MRFLLGIFVGGTAAIVAGCHANAVLAPDVNDRPQHGLDAPAVRSIVEDNHRLRQAEEQARCRVIELETQLVSRRIADDAARREVMRSPVVGADVDDRIPATNIQDRP